MTEMECLDPCGVLAAAESALAEIKRQDAATLRLAAHWADLHHPDSLPPVRDPEEARRRRREGEYGVVLGGEGTPPVLRSCLAELGSVLETSAGGAKHLIADALDLRHRLPRIWHLATSGGLRAWKARQVAAATRHLPREVVDEVDAGLADLLPALPWSRLATVLEATVKRVDPGPSRLAEEEAAQRRFVEVGRSNTHGITTLIARGTALDIQTFLAAVKRIADVLGAEGDPDPLDVRRSKAVGILGQPLRALALLTLHRDDPDEGEPEPPEAAEATEGEGPGPDGRGRRSLDLRALATTDLAELRRLAASGPRVRLVVHLTESAVRGLDPRAVARVEGVGPLTAATVRRWLGRPDVAVTVRPVAVPGWAVPVDAYEIPRATREAVRLRSPASTFPWSGCTSATMDLDHVEAYRPPARGGPPGQTRPGNLAPLARGEHGLKTGGRWQTRSPAPGVQLWRTPHGWIHLVTGQGTYALGRTSTARALWRAAGTVPEETHAVLPPERGPDGAGSVLEGYLRDLVHLGPAGLDVNGWTRPLPGRPRARSPR